MISNYDDFVNFVHEWLSAPPGSLIYSGEIPDNLPNVLKRYYEQLGGINRPADESVGPYALPLSTQDGIRRPETIVVFQDMIEFAFENQENWYARCSVSTDDPIVLTNWAELLGKGSGYHPTGAKLSEFLITLTLQELVILDCIDEKLELDFQPLWLDGYLSTISTEGPTHSFYVTMDKQYLGFCWGSIEGKPKTLDWIAKRPVVKRW